jgi:hypothetical protein
MNTRFTSTHPWNDTTWISEEWIEQERKSHLDCSWYIDQNYNCIAVVRGGRVFRNLIIVGSEENPQFPYGYLDAVTATHGGVDFNGENVGHYLEKIAYDDEYVYFIEEINFQDLTDLFNHLDVSLELEDGLFNTAFTDQTKRMGLDCIYQEWNEEIKHQRVQKLVDRKIIINPHRTPIAYKNLLEAGWDEKSPRPKLAKRADQHGLDGGLHAMHGESGQLTVITRKEQKGLFGKPTMAYNILRI